MDIPYVFIMFALTHNKNITANMRRSSASASVTSKKKTLTNKKSGKEINFIDIWPEEARVFFKEMSKLFLIESPKEKA